MSSEADVERWIFGTPENARFTQDSPILPEVWQRFAAGPGERQDLLLTPHQDSSAAELISCLCGRLGGEPGDDSGGHGIAYNEGYVVAYLDFHELIREVLPLSAWWVGIWPPRVKALGPWLGRKRSTPARELAWVVNLIGAVEAGRREEREVGPKLRLALGIEAVEEIEFPKPGAPTPLWSVNLNRSARTALYKSRLAIKADAAERVFSVRSEGLRWAIVDTGVDATHPAFRRRAADGALEAAPEGKENWGNSRVVATYDFTRLRPIVSGRLGDLGEEQRDDLERRVKSGQALDWDALKPLLAVPHDKDYPVPLPDHGTHIAGIVGGDWRQSDDGMTGLGDLVGVCPDIELYDLRVFDANGKGEEFALLGALQFIRHLNGHSDLQVLHGANLSLSLDLSLANYAVGRTPICDECERLMSNGVVVVAAAGNDGQARYQTAAGQPKDGFRTVTITDPGNAEGVITVGSTHRRDPHTYGVSYFSSRGPTGDGRVKPDLVAPGEKIEAPAPGGNSQVKDGTSQATAHVSGIAAMLMARYPELVGQPREVKRILCGTATDLGRERYFQGAGMIDALRALQEV